MRAEPQHLSLVCLNDSELLKLFVIAIYSKLCLCLVLWLSVG